MAAIRWSSNSSARFLCRSATGSLAGALVGAGVSGVFLVTDAGLNAPTPPPSRCARCAGRKWPRNVNRRYAKRMSALTRGCLKMVKMENAINTMSRNTSCCLCEAMAPVVRGEASMPAGSPRRRRAVYPWRRARERERARTRGEGAAGTLWHTVARRPLVCLLECVSVHGIKKYRIFIHNTVYKCTGITHILQYITVRDR